MRNSKKRDTRCVLLRDGSARRVPCDTAEQMIKSGQAKQYISNTVFRAIELGVDVDDPSTSDQDGSLRDKVRGAHERERRRRNREDDRRTREEFELLEDDVV
jgi:hypothetical protein